MTALLARLTPAQRRLLLRGGVALACTLGIAHLTVNLYGELAWFRSLGYEARFWRLTVARGVAWAVVVGISGGVLYGVLWGVARRVGPIRVRRRLGDLVIAEALPGNRVRLAALALAALVALLVAAPVAGTLGERILLLLHARGWERPEPILGHDPRFYVFVLPTLRVVWSLALSLLLWAALALAGVFSATGRIQTGPRSLRIEPFARRRLAGIGSAALILLAGHFALSASEAVGEGPIRYAIVHAEIPARRLAAVLALVAAGLLPWSERRGRWRPSLYGLGALAVAWLVGVGVYPDLVQRLRVDPNELELERPYLAANIAATRAAFAVATTRERPYPVVRQTPPLEKARQWTSSLPLWDERPLRATYNQLQGLLAYHEFPDVDYDRYGPPGEQEQVAVAVREFSPQRLTGSARTWLNLHQRYTYGQGVAVSPVDRMTEGGEPEYYVRDLPPVRAPSAPAELELHQPRVYFGERTTRFAVLTGDSLPSGPAPSGVRAEGLKRAAFAWALGSRNLLLRGDAKGGSLLAWRRHVVERVQHLVPFLQVDPDPLPVIHDGRVHWVLDLYAVTGRYPLAQRAELRGARVGYVRDAAKAVVDGVTGEVRLYLRAGADPLASTVAAALPGLFRPLAEMPGALRAHLRYPRALLRAQAEILEAYHLTDPDDFYRAQDLWSVAREVYGERTVPVEPYYLLMPHPAGDDSRPEFLLTVPFTPRNRDNLVAFLVARSDGERYGELALFRASSTRQVFGPRQVEVQIEQDPAISQQLSLWRQLGSRATRGHLLLVPIDGFLLYVEPLFLEAEDQEGAAPGLKRVIVSGGDRVAMGATLGGALAELLGEGAPTEPKVADPPGPRLPAATAPIPPGLAARLRAADEALRRGDLAAFAARWEEVRRWLQPEGGTEPTGGGAPPPPTREGAP